MKKLVCLWMTLAMLLGVLPALAAQVDPVDALLTQLDAMLTGAEQINALRQDACERMADFCEKQDYVSLVAARIACDNAQSEADMMTAPAFTLTDDTILALMQLQVETDALEMEVKGVAAEIATHYEFNEFATLLDTYLINCDNLDFMTQTTAVQLDYLTLERQSVCLFVNYLLLPLAERAQVRAFWAAMPEKYPTISGGLAPWNDDPNVLIETTVEVLDGMDACISRMSELSGLSAYLLEEYAAVLQGSLEPPKPVKIEGMPAMLPLPLDWMEPETSIIVPSDTGADGLPETLTLWDMNVTLDQYKAYVVQLVEYGATVHQMEGDDDNGWRDVLLYDGHVLVANWYTQGAVVLGYTPAGLSLEPAVYVHSWNRAHAE